MRIAMILSKNPVFFCGSGARETFGNSQNFASASNGFSNLALFAAFRADSLLDGGGEKVDPLTSTPLSFHKPAASFHQVRFSSQPSPLYLLSSRA